MSGRTTDKVYHFILYLIGIAVLLAAVAITLIRLALPDIGQHKNAIETWVSSYMGQAFVIDSISADWQGWIPRLYLNGIHLRSKDGLRKIVSFDTAILEVSPFRSLWKLQPVPRRLVISGLRVSVSRLPTGAILVEGMNINSMDAGHENEFAKWLFGQDQIDINKADILWLDHKHRQAPVQLTDVSLAIRTDGSRSQLMGEAKLPGKYGNRMNFALDATGDLWSSDWSGDLYAAATQVNPDNWYREFQPERITPAGGSADLEIWSSWKDAKPNLLQGRLEYHNFALLSADGAVRVEELASRFRAEKLMDTNWHISLKLDRLITENGGWPTANLEVLSQTGKDGQARRYALSFDYLNLADLMPLTAGLELIPDTISRSITPGSIRCELDEGLVIYDAGTGVDEPFVYDFAFRNLATDLAPGQPAISKLSGRLRGSTNRASLTLEGTPGEFNIPSVYDNSISFTHLNGTIFWRRVAGGWKLQTDKLSLISDDLSLTIKGELEKDEAQPLPYLNLVTELDSDRLENLFRYMPYTPKFRIREWMQKSLRAGHIDSAIAVIRGYPNEFPFRDNNGQLQGIVNLSDSVVEYSPKWPIVDNVDAAVLFDNEKMTATVHRGGVFGAKITSGTGMIRDLTKRPKVVVLDGKVKGETKDLGLFISQSPLSEDNILKYANETLVSGNIDLDLDLSIPIKAPEMQSVITGTLKLDGAKLDSGDSNVELDDVNGVVSFTRDSVAGRDLSARFAGQPVTLRLSGSKNSTDTPPAFVIAGHSADAFIIEQILRRYPGSAYFVSRLGERLSGSADWQARFSFQQTDQGLVQHLDLSSDLYGLAIDLPKPVWKPTYSRRMLTFSKTLQGTTPAELNYASVINARIKQEQGNKQKLDRLDVFLGEGSQTTYYPTDSGIYLSGYTEILSLDDWRETIAFFSPEQVDETGFFRSANINMELDTARLDVFDQSFRDTGLHANRGPENWHIHLRGEDVSGEIVLPKNPTLENRVRLDLEKLVISKAEDKGIASNVDPKNLPSLRIDVADFVYGDYELGKTRLVASSVPAGLSFDEIEFVKPGLNIAGTGTWKKSGSANSSSFNIRLRADKFNKMLDTFGYDVAAIKKGKTDISINADWASSPDDFSLDKLVGNLDVHLKKGQLLEVSPSAGRLFGLLSLQTLPRRLSLDFTDLFGKGLAFDHIKGSFNIINGNAYTNDLRLTGPGADVSISGRTGLTDQDYDQIVTVTPQFADNLPIASALLGPVGIGVGAVLYLAGNMFESINDNIDKMLSYQYTIKGNWYNPRIEKLKDPPADKQVSAQPTPQPIYPAPDILSADDVDEPR